VKNVGQYGTRRWENNLEPILENLQALKVAQDKGAQIIVVTARSDNFRARITALLQENGVTPHNIITGCYHSHRVMINDYAATNPYPSCSAVSLPRDSLLSPYLQDYLS
jgi:ribonucleotide monophosphatase NagD (HAD superfamily)